jgi:hypothetical protein
MRALRAACPECGKQIKVDVQLAWRNPGDAKDSLSADDIIAVPNLDRVWKHYAKHVLGGGKK